MGPYSSYAAPMQNESQPRLEPIFHAACARAAGAERQAYLDGACGDDADLRTRVEALLAAHEAAGGFLDSPAIEGSREGPGTSIGVYKLLQEIGEGGMGVVYMAEQESPVRRKVALKIIKLGMDTKQVIARFEAERQALAMMDHAGIARVFDAGSTEAGRPYFVMELVRGVPIDEYCDTHKLSTEKRLGLFVEVCRAVQHAHQKGIIHRDLKPTNVLVTSHDGTPVPKIIDFGVAKATNQRLTERTLFTEYHQIIGTPEYMSPEQAEMSGLDVDTRSDIYSLGVLLYQLLTGTTPADPTDLRTAAFAEMTRMIREDEPPAPSTRISKLGANGEKIAKHRGSDAGSLSRHFRGDLDWIVMRALEKDRTRRYNTASAFAEDVVRHLEDRPVEAGPPGAVYRVAKFAHRNRKAVVAALVLVAVVGLGLAGTIAGFLSARAEADRSGEISDSLQDVLSITHSANATDQSDVENVLATVREVFGEDHATFAAVLDTLALRLHDAGDFETAAELCRESLTVWKKIHGEQHPNVAITLARLGSSLRAQGDDERAESALRAALTILDGASDTPGLAGYDARVELADLLANRGEYAEADALIEESLALLRASPSPAHFRILETLERRAVLQLSQPSADARETLREIYDEAHEFYPDDSPVLALAALGYGRQLFQHGEHEKAEPYLREAVQRFSALAEPPRIYLLGARDALFQIVRGRDDLESILETDDLLRDTIEGARKIWGADALAMNLKFYASRMFERERFGEALDAMLDAHQTLVDASRSVDERESLRDNLAMLAFKVAYHPDLDPEIYTRARDAAERGLLEEPDHPAMIVALGAVLYRQGEFALAAEILERAKPLDTVPGGLARGISPADHAFRAMAHARLGDDAAARAELEALRTALTGRNDGDGGPAILREVEALVEHTPSSIEDD
jgi:eukaryotic-like serine/threonine-protein kinase